MNLLFDEDLTFLKQRLLNQYEELNENDFVYANSDPNRLLSRLQWKLGISKRDVISVIEKL